MAKVTITFEDLNEGVSVEVQSDPPFPEKMEENATDLTDAQQMALSMTMMFDQQMQQDEVQVEPTKHKCCGGGKCLNPHKTQKTES